MILLERIAASGRQVVAGVEVAIDINSCLVIVSYDVDGVSRTVWSLWSMYIPDECIDYYAAPFNDSQTEPE
jgi:hypothetical protein